MSDATPTSSSPGTGTALLRDSPSRRTALLVLVAAMLAGGVFHLPRRENAPAGSTSTNLDPTPSVRIERATTSSGGAETGGSADVLTSLLFRYDALIRHVEAQAVRTADPQVDSALAELRELRARTYAAGRRTTTANASRVIQRP